jgi:hypothetical protein
MDNNRRINITIDEIIKHAYKTIDNNILDMTPENFAKLSKELTFSIGYMLKDLKEEIES